MSKKSIEGGELVECVTHLPFAMANFFLCLHDDNLMLAHIYLLCEEDRLYKIGTRYQLPMPERDWTRLRAFAIEAGVPADFFIEEPYRFSEDIKKIHALRKDTLEALAKRLKDQQN